MYFTGIFLTESKAVCISFANSAVLQYFRQTTVNYFFEQKKIRTLSSKEEKKKKRL